MGLCVMCDMSVLYVYIINIEHMLYQIYTVSKAYTCTTVSSILKAKKGFG
jgi:hypothetical protein